MEQVPEKVQKTGSLDKWRCPKCSFDNLELMPACEICQEPREKSPKKLQLPQEQSKKVQPGIICPNTRCKHFNPLTVDFCQQCGEQIFGQCEESIKKDSKPSSEPKKELAACKHCGFENDPQNSICVNCERKLIPKRIPRKSVKPRKYARSARYYGSTSPCQTCGQPLRVIDVTTGQRDICMECEAAKTTVFTKSLCIFCDTKIKPSQQKDHDEKCEARKIFFSKDENLTFDRCTPLQYETMVYMHNKSQKLHYRKEKALIERIKKIGYTEKDLQNLHHYIIHYAPIIIHMHVNTHFHFFLKDTHYRNQFQTSKSSGSLSTSARTNWEDRMFDKKHHNATGFERVKYGTMNFTNDPKGVRACSGYGQSYFLLKTHVRDRCTITDMDSSSPAATIATFRFIFHLLMKLSDAELHSAFEGSKGNQMKSNVIGAYKEIQIHGPVEFSKDIERLYISKDQLKLGDAKGLLEQVKSFCSKHKLEYQLFQNQQPKPGGAYFGGVLAVGASKAEERIVGDAKQLTEQDLKPKPPPAPVFGGLAAGGVSLFGGGGSLFGGGFGAVPSAYPAGAGLFPASAYGYSHYSFGVPVAFPPKPPEKKKEYGVDYI